VIGYCLKLICAGRNCPLLVIVMLKRKGKGVAGLAPKEKEESIIYILT